MTALDLLYAHRSKTPVYCTCCGRAGVIVAINPDGGALVEWSTGRQTQTHADFLSEDDPHAWDGLRVISAK